MMANMKSDTSTSSNTGNPLDEEQQERLNGVRRQLWRGGASGALGGIIAGIAGCQIIKYMPQMKPHRTKNIYTLVMLLTPAIGAFLNSSVVGTNEIQTIGDIFERNRSFEPGSYKAIVHENRLKELREMDGAFERRQKHLEQHARQKSEELTAGLPQRN